MVPNFTCTTPPDLRPHIDIKAALPTVEPLKERCLETEGKQWETKSSANKVATKETYLTVHYGEQGWRRADCTRLPPTWPGL